MIEFERCHFCDKIIIYYENLTDDEAKNLQRLLISLDNLNHILHKNLYEEGSPEGRNNKIGNKHICRACLSELSHHLNPEDD